MLTSILFTKNLHRRGRRGTQRTQGKAKQGKNGNRALLAWIFLVALAGLLPAAVRGQSGAAGRRPPSPTPVTRNDDPAATIRVNVRLVNVFTTVTDAHGAPVSGLHQEDFRVLEDGVPQAIRVFDKESEMPLSIALAVDTSESTRRDLRLEVASAKKFARSIVRPQDRLAIFQVSDNIDQLTRFTADMTSIDHAIDRLMVGAGTSLYDAVFLASDLLIDRQGRKVLVLITDGGDTTSKTTYANALRRAQEAEAIIYSIIVVPVAADAGRNLGGEHALIQMSKDTGGKYYYAESIDQLDQAFRQISEELRTQYLIAYYPSRRISDSAFRKIEVEIAKKEETGEFHVRHRAGYFTAPAK
ncbi:MAG: VWA domain-containing protein [Acidobacteriia bacterium]|nr:VWA domain-containing protein [Terriglobia bacterium]